MNNQAVGGDVHLPDDLIDRSGIDQAKLSEIVQKFGVVVAWTRWRKDAIADRNCIFFFLDEREIKKIGLDETRRLVERAGYSMLEKRDCDTSRMSFEYVKSGHRRIVLYHGSKAWLESNSPGVFRAPYLRDRQWDGYQLIYRDSSGSAKYEYVCEAVRQG